MSIAKNLKKSFLLCFVLSFLGFASCTFYKTVQIDKNRETIASYYNSGKRIVVHDSNEQKEFFLSNLHFDNDSLTGTLSAVPNLKKHDHHKRTFRKGSVKAYEPRNTMHLFTIASDIQNGPFGIPLSSLKLVEIHEKDIFGSVMATTGLVLLGTAVGVTGFLLIACNCPQVASYNASETQYYGSLFPGSVFKSLIRDDYLVLHDPLRTEQGQLKLRISNELPEHQYIDQLEILEVNHEGYAHLGLNNEGQLTAYNELDAPDLAMNGSYQDILPLLKHQDALSYDFDDPGDEDQLNELILTFDRAKFSDRPALFLHAQQSQWLDTLSSFIFHQAGKAQNKWVDRKDDSSPEKWKNQNKKRGLSLNVYLKVNEDWQYVGTHHDVGTKSKRKLLMEMDLRDVRSPLIEIKLESAFKIWEIDYAGLTDEWRTELYSQTLDPLVAKSHLGADVSQQISTTDEKYLIQKEMGNYVELQLNLPPPKLSSTIVLHGTGYYHQIIDNDQKPNRAFFMHLRKKLGFHEVSRALYLYRNAPAFAQATEESTTVSRHSN